MLLFHKFSLNLQRQMNRILTIFISIIAVSLVACATKSNIPAKKYEPSDSVSEEQKRPLTRNELIALEIKNAIKDSSKNNIVFQNRVVGFQSSLKGLYIQRAYSTAWYDDVYGFENPKTENLVKILLESESEGLNPESYNIDIISKNIPLSGNNNLADIALFDILLTNSVLTYASHILYGDPQIGKFVFDNPYLEEQFNLSLIFNDAISKNNLDGAINSLKPQNPVYDRLISSLAKYKKIKENGGWPSIKDGKKLSRGSVDPRVAILRRRLIVSGDLEDNINSKVDLNSESKSSYDKFDLLLENAVKKFQNRHNLLVDGVVGSGTIEALNIPVDEKIRHIKLNLNMWRKLPSDMGNKFVLVNIPFFKLYTFENQRPIGEMKVIVGKNNWNTPLFSDEITYLEVNPYWNIPKSILIEDIIPKAKEDPNYIRKNNIRIVDGWGSEENEENLNIMNSYVEYIDWNEVDADNWQFRLRQEPGADNPLGRIKFMFPNKHNVYLHDTPLKEYFNRSARSFSHGCIRVEKPFLLADFLLANNPDWSSEQLQYQIDSGKNKTVSLNIPVPVHIMYFTVWADEKDTYFTKDIYNIYRL